MDEEIASHQEVVSAERAKALMEAATELGNVSVQVIAREGVPYKNKDGESLTVRNGNVLVKIAGYKYPDGPRALKSLADIIQLAEGSKP